MAKFISVLDTHLGLSFWQAVQWADDLNTLVNNPLYTAGVNITLPKNSGDKRVPPPRRIVERSTGFPADATIIQLSTLGQNLLALAKAEASDNVVAKLTANMPKTDTDK